MSNPDLLHCGAKDKESQLYKRLAGPTILALLALCFSLAATRTAAGAEPRKGYEQTNLLSNGAVDAAHTDEHFINPWGVSIGPSLWINSNVAGVNYIASGNGAISFTVPIPPASGSGPGSPTGTVFTGSAPAGSFLLRDKSAPSFLFCTLDGTISGWGGEPTAQIAVNNSKKNAVYTDMALVTNTKGTFLLVTNFGAGADVEVYDEHYKRALTTEFKDPHVPTTYAPYAVHVFGDSVFVTYTPRTVPEYQEILGAGHGFVDEFDTSGKFIARAIPAGGKLDAPWGMAVAPATFGEFANDVLVGNFGDGTIAAFDPKTWQFKGRIADENGNLIANPGLWEIFFGQANPAVGNPKTLYFTAGLEHETAGLYGAINVAGTGVTKTKTSVTSDGNPSSKGDKVTFTALVQPKAGSGEPEGHVKFTVDGKALATVRVDSTAHAMAVAPKLAVGNHKVTAAYSGDGNFSASSGSMTEAITAPQTAAPIISPATGNYSVGTSVSITDSTPHAVIYFTTDGTAPSTKSTVYTKPFQISKTTTVKAIAAGSGLPESAVVSATFNIATVSPTAVPTFTPAPAYYTSTQQVTIKDTTPGAVIYYTLDGSTPTTTSAVFKGAISVANSMTIKAMAVAKGWSASAVATGAYTISTGGGW